jgi:hypothetical protein
MLEGSQPIVFEEEQSHEVKVQLIFFEMSTKGDCHIFSRLSVFGKRRHVAEDANFDPKEASKWNCRLFQNQVHDVLECFGHQHEVKVELINPEISASVRAHLDFREKGRCM